MAAGLRLTGPARYRIRSLAQVVQSAASVSICRTLARPARRECNWHWEVRTQLLRRQLATAFSLPDVNEARRYLDTIVMESPALAQVRVEPVAAPVRGSWFFPPVMLPGRMLLFLHGGGYSFYPRAYSGLISAIALAAKSRTFALDYRLSPEHRFPAQLDDTSNAYLWLLSQSADPVRSWL